MRKTILAALSIFTLNCGRMECEEIINDIKPSHSDMAESSKSDLAEIIKKRLTVTADTKYGYYYDIKLKCTCLKESVHELCKPSTILYKRAASNMAVDKYQTPSTEFCGKYTEDVSGKVTFYSWESRASDAYWPGYELIMDKKIMTEAQFAKEGE